MQTESREFAERLHGVVEVRPKAHGVGQSGTEFSEYHLAVQVGLGANGAEEAAGGRGQAEQAHFLAKAAAHV